MFKKLYILKAAVLLAAFLVSCNSEEIQTSIEDYQQMKDSLSVETAHHVEIVYTDSAILRAKIRAELMQHFPNEKDPFLLMSDGVKADFYNPFGEIQSSLTANSAKSYDRKDIIEIRDSVRVINKNDEEIKSDELIWDKRKRRIYSDKHVRVRIRDEKIIMAEGFESDETFIKYKLKKITGVVYLEEDGVEVIPEQ